MIRWSDFRKNYCKHQGAILEFNKEEGPVLACCYKDKKLAQLWEDWQPCTKENCPALKNEVNEYGKNESNYQKTR